MKKRNVAVIDVGSNTIKLLVATRGVDGAVTPLDQASEATRIGVGMGSNHAALTTNVMQAGIVSIKKLLEQSKNHSPEEVRIVATGAVRDAVNGLEFAQRVEEDTGHPLCILSGSSEATGIAAGLLTDPELNESRDFLACDLGGGSLELILVVDRSVQAKVSLPLGAVRLTERFIPNPHAPVPVAETDAIEAHVRKTLADSGFPFADKTSLLIATGGSFYTTRLILAKREGIRFEERSRLSREDFAELRVETARLSLEGRHRHFPELPPNRADVLAAAFSCIIALLDHANAQEIRNSLRNLRFGIAAELLAEST